LNRDVVFCNFYEAASSNLMWCRHCLPVRKVFDLVYGLSLLETSKSDLSG